MYSFIHYIVGKHMCCVYIIYIYPHLCITSHNREIRTKKSLWRDKLNLTGKTLSGKKYNFTMERQHQW